MDGMALLCNLHADGPETLRSLRDEGCTSLQQLRELEPERLAQLLGFTPAAARRFLREGRVLLERLDGVDLEREEPARAPAVAAAAGPARELQPGELPLNEQALLARVLEHWQQAEAAPTATPAVTPEDVPEAVSADIEELDPDDPDRLRSGLFEGLDERTCAALAAQGVASLTELSSRPPEALARECGLAFTTVRRLQFLARRAAQADVLPALEPTPRRQVVAGEKISLAFPDLPLRPPAPEREPSSASSEREQPGGPFA